MVGKKTIIKKIDDKNIAEVISLLCLSFYNDTYFKKLFPNSATRMKDMGEQFKPCLFFSLRNGFSTGVFDKGKLVALSIAVDYSALCKDKEIYKSTFMTDVIDEAYPIKLKLEEKMSKFTGNTLYHMLIAVDESYRKMGIATSFIDYMIKTYGECYNIIADVSSEISLLIYKKRGFNIEEIDEGYYFVSRESIKIKE